MDRATIAEAITITLKLLTPLFQPVSTTSTITKDKFFPVSILSPVSSFPRAVFSLIYPLLAPAFVPAYGICSLEPGLSGQVINMDIFRFSSTVETCTRGQTQAKIWADPTRNQERWLAAKGYTRTQKSEQVISISSKSYILWGADILWGIDSHFTLIDNKS